MEKQQISYYASVLMKLNGNWEIEANNQVKDHIHYANGTNNWCPEDLQSFEQELDLTNPDYQAFIQFLKENGYANLSDNVLGTLWVIKCGITEEMVNIGPADAFGKVPTNSFIQLLIENEMAEFKKLRKKQLRKNRKIPREKAGPKGNPYHAAYEKYIVSMLPWLRSIQSIKNNKEAFMLIGLVLWLGGHSELRMPFELTPPHNKKIANDGTPSMVPIPFNEYLYGRMKRVFYDSPAFAA